ncbi:hypothetical protein F1C58_16775 (plasmid) [Glaciihabitans sp. INWT7]|uniref:hypothetical protein n=1 Tax=Glaciihabitans sp. INWT7 TaxID=2596912 RepID=UPI00162A1C5C|nr:hypothetical protein [Glaciihabitans sp. INWT7]QNE48712.1 hypothetical protein F1C58_16775 [Glaciihabitans sp. INWT7]
MRAIRASLGSARGAIDLASIMVGVLVIGVIGSVIAVSVFAVIPWAQNSAAQQSLGSVRTAESVAFVKGDLVVPHRGYFTMSELVAAKLIQASDRTVVAVDTDHGCYVAVSRSATGKDFFSTSSSAEVAPFDSDVTDTVLGCVTDIRTAMDSLPASGGSGAVVIPPAPAGPVSLEVNSISRDATTGYLNIDVNVVAKDYGIAGAVCETASSYCAQVIEGTLVDGTKSILATVYTAGGAAAIYPHTENIVSSTFQGQVVSLRAYLFDGYHYTPAVQIGSPSVPINDPYKGATSSLAINSITRDPTTGFFNFDATLTANGYGLPDSACPSYGHYCTESLEATLADGSTTVLQADRVNGGEYATYPYTKRFTGSSYQGKIVSLRAFFQDGSVANGKQSTSAATPVTDPYSGAKATLVVNSISRDSTSHNFSFDVTLTANGFGQPDSACPNYANYCMRELEATLADGSTTQLSVVRVDGGSYAKYPNVDRITGSLPMSKVVAIRAYFHDASVGNGKQSSSATIPVSDSGP